MKREYLVYEGFGGAIVANLDEINGSKLELLAEKQTTIKDDEIFKYWIRGSGNSYAHSLPMLSSYFNKIYRLGEEFYRELMRTGKLPFDDKDITKYECQKCNKINQGSPILQAVIGNPLSSFLTEAEADYFCKLCDNLVFGHVLNMEEAKKLIGERGLSFIRFDGSGDFITPTQSMIEEQLRGAFEDANEDGVRGDFLFSPALKQAEQWAKKIGYDITDRHMQVISSYRVKRKLHKKQLISSLD